MPHVQSLPPPPVVRVNRHKLLKFFDEKPKSSLRHATAVVAVAGEELGVRLLKHYLESVKHSKVTVLDKRCSLGTRKGRRLDCWILVTRSHSKTLYQVEVKNSSAHAIGGKVLPVDASLKDHRAFMAYRWSCHWDAKRREFGDIGTDKVLLKMKPPKGYEQYRVMPILCMWEAVHILGTVDKPLFCVRRDHKRGFKALWVFSMSAYLRSLTCSHIDIEMASTVARLKWLKVLFNKAA